MWHKPSSTSSNPPIAVHAWLEQGYQLRSALIQPKFCWQETHCKQTQSDKSIFDKSFTFHAVDLLDISKIIPVDDYIDRDKLPFVKTKCSFILEALGSSHVMVFEARDETERDNIIAGLKLVVARLSSKIIVGDKTVLYEFFNPHGDVPGHVPAILQNE